MMREGSTGRHEKEAGRRGKRRATKEVVIGEKAATGIM